MSPRNDSLLAVIVIAASVLFLWFDPTDSSHDAPHVDAHDTTTTPHAWVFIPDGEAVTCGDTSGVYSGDPSARVEVLADEQATQIITLTAGTATDDGCRYEIRYIQPGAANLTFRVNDHGDTQLGDWNDDAPSVMDSPSRYSQRGIAGAAVH